MDFSKAAHGDHRRSFLRIHRRRPRLLPHLGALRRRNRRGHFFPSQVLFNNGLSAFWAQLTADTVIDVIDKLITVIPIYFLLKKYPRSLYGKFPLKFHLREGFIAGGGSHVNGISPPDEIHQHADHLLIIASTTLVSVLSIAISSMYYQKSYRIGMRKSPGRGSLAAGYVDASRIDDF